jgi:hypothetical protein
MRNGTKKNREEKKFIFTLSEKKKSFMSGRSYELLAQQQKKSSDDEEMKEMRNMKIFLCINLHFIFLSPNDDLFTISSHCLTLLRLPLSGFWHYDVMKRRERVGRVAYNNNRNSRILFQLTSL